MSEVFSQKPVFDALERYLKRRDLVSLIITDRRFWEKFENDMVFWYKLCDNNVFTTCRIGRLNLVKYACHKKSNYYKSLQKYEYHQQCGIPYWSQIEGRLNLTLLFEMDVAAAAGHLHIVQWLHENQNDTIGKICSNIAMDAAARNGHLEVVKWLHENRNEGCTKLAMDHAAENGYLDVVKFLHENRNEGCTKHAMFGSVRKGHFEMVKWLHLNGYHLMSENNIRIAAENGHFEILKYLYRNMNFVKKHSILTNIEQVKIHIHILNQTMESALYRKECNKEVIDFIRNELNFYLEKARDFHKSKYYK